MHARIWLSLVVAAQLSSHGVAAETDRHPDVLFIVVDDMNDWVGYLGGHPQAQTPNIDALAARGAAFTNAHAAAPVCNPSRTAVLTGRYPFATGVVGNRAQWRDRLPDAVTLSEHFREHGYEAVGIGKIHHTGQHDASAWDRSLPIVRGSGGMERSSVGVGHVKFSTMTNADEDFADYVVATLAADELTRERNRPLFLAVGLTTPHMAWRAPAARVERIPPEDVVLPETLAGDLLDLPAFHLSVRTFWHRKLLTSGRWNEAVRTYLATHSLVDAQIGRILAALEASGGGDDAIVVLWSDHGYHLGEKQHWGKTTLWEESTRVPLVISAPGSKHGVEIDRAVDLVSLYPTIAELAGLPLRPELDGESLVPLMVDPSSARSRPALTTQGNHHSVRTERWRLIRYADGGVELYDHAADPLEWHNLASDPAHAGTRERLTALLPAATSWKSKRKRAEPGTGSGP